jgi:hypothetical protein
MLLGAVGSGDANLDGAVDVSDLAVLAGFWETGPGTRTWLEGDFDFNGSVDVSDLAALAGNWGAGTSGSGAGDASVDELASVVGLDTETGGGDLSGSSDGGLIQAAPEPATLALLGLGAATLLTRRRATGDVRRR